MNKTKAYFAAGCFWGIEEAFRKTEGVLDTAAGFMGGEVENPTYNQVCGGETGHAETVEVVYNPEVITYSDLLDKFWEIHDPTQLNRQGPDIGSQYRSVIFFTNENQRKLALESKEKMEKLDKYKDKIVTDIREAGDFYKAEDYHQKYKAKMKGEL